MMFQYVKHSFLSGSHSSVWRRVREGAPAVKQTRSLLVIELTQLQLSFCTGCHWWIRRLFYIKINVLHWLISFRVNIWVLFHWHFWQAMPRWSAFPLRGLASSTESHLRRSISRVGPKWPISEPGAMLSRPALDVAAPLPSPPVQACVASARVCAGGTREKRRF